MKKSTLVLLSASALVLLGATAAFAGPVIYRDLVVGEQPGAPAITLPPAPDPGAGGETAELDGSWAVAAGSFAGYRVDEVLNGTEVTVVGRTDRVSGSLTVEGLRLTAATIDVDVASITTDSANRDDYFRQNAVRADEHPTARFVLTEPVTTTARPLMGERQTVTASGELTIAGVTRAIVVELEAVFDGVGGQVVGSIPLAFADFGVEAPNLGFVAVEPEGFVEFSLAISPR